ncbi:hypothetical protein K1Y77_17210 (plasmid) [Halomonas qaidamensis]|uniref:Uncharacterized protein n=1 Tax=Halomonas qaidamensis TaxID=2866211 RepID=A0ABY6JUG6_9GAMM|nr:hypothetical protein [Halomonas qaidamensis]UYV20901.1 hypothetical protein K1Y77_17210 [Halomonas qaidamensis]
MIDQQGMTQGFNNNALVGINQRDTLQNIDVMLEYLQTNGEDQHAGTHMILTLVRDALGHELQQSGKLGAH